MSGIKNIILALLLGLLTGGIAGFYARGKFVEASQVEVMKEQRQDDVQSVAQMQKDEAELQQSVRASRANIEVIRAEVKKHAIKAEGSHEVTQVKVDCRNAPIGSDLVGLLNDARADTPVDPATGSNGEGATTAEADIERNRR